MLVALLLSAALATVQTSPAAALAFTPCPSEAASGFSCAALSVPLDRSGTVGGSVELSVERLDSSPTHAAPSKAAVVALAGGPGQAALPLAAGMAKTIAAALTTRDLLVFDQRGTGRSGPLACASLEGAEALGSIGQAFERCAVQIGARRRAYTTQESVADIEALRQAGGYEKLVLFGVSYGTKVALEYAERYP
ncbi:MAG TPA: alpha/beta fold hydrolase, partial [Solirubrobacteraceae bacterium]|nr:alpha/beta fold hydrolase [Solirubrobacteraceae bacterium]